VFLVTAQALLLDPAIEDPDVRVEMEMVPMAPATALVNVVGLAIVRPVPAAFLQPQGTFSK
jgi:hypothetical protein